MAHIGLDLDNTIIDYNRAFPAVGEMIGLLPPGHGLTDKAAVKAHLLAAEDGMERWMRLQGQIYGRYIGEARAFQGVEDFLAGASAAGHRLSVVSHKTKFGHYDDTRTNLWTAARHWLRTAAMVGDIGRAIREHDVFFETTRDAKLRRIGEIGCDVFIDDLPEVLTDAKFPPGVARLWFTGASGDRPIAGDPADLTAHGSWRDIAEAVAKILAATTDRG